MIIIKDAFFIEFGLLVELLPEHERNGFDQLQLYFKYDGKAQFSYHSYREKKDVVVSFDTNSFLTFDGLLEDVHSEPSATNYYLSKYTLDKEKNELCSFDYPLTLQNQITPDYFAKNIFAELSSFVHWIIDSKSIEYLNCSERINLFLSKLIKTSPEINSENSEVIHPFANLVLKYFDKVGVDSLRQIIGSKRPEPLPINKQEEEELEKEINGRLWFDFDSLSKYWSKYNLTKSDILHFAETGKLQVCIDWVAAFPRKLDYKFKYQFGQHKSISRLIDFIKNQPTKPQFENHYRIHTYSLSPRSSSKYIRLASVAEEDIKEFISNGKVENPICHVNEFLLTYSNLRGGGFYDEKHEDIILHEHQLLVTAREVRLFEKDFLGEIDSKSEASNTHNQQPKHNTQPITAAQENSHLRVMGALLKTIEERSKKPFTLDRLKFELEEKYGKGMDIKGFSKSNLDTLFARANKALKDK